MTEKHINKTHKVLKYLSSTLLISSHLLSNYIRGPTTIL